tara:strand:+ start:1046 stop:1873 length:828 start_codon:yes stop_codon:yes gene_type:complete
LIKDQVTRISNKNFFLAESPTMLSKNKLAWIDIYERELLILNLNNKKIKQKKFKQFLGFLIFNKDNLIIGLENEIINYSLLNGKTSNLIKIDLDKGLRTNDAFLDNFGNLWFGVLDEKKKWRGGLYCKYKFKQKPVKIFDNINTPNGPVFISSKEFFFNDTSRQITFKCKITKTCIEKKEFKIFSKNQKPDGMFFDKKKKKLWICFFGCSSVNCYNMNGKLLGSIKLKAKNLTKCVIDKYRKNTMYVTSAYKNLTKKTYDNNFDGFIYKIKNKLI